MSFFCPSPFQILFSLLLTVTPSLFFLFFIPFFLFSLHLFFFCLYLLLALFSSLFLTDLFDMLLFIIWIFLVFLPFLILSQFFFNTLYSLLFFFSSFRSFFFFFLVLPSLLLSYHWPISLHPISIYYSLSLSFIPSFHVSFSYWYHPFYFSLVIGQSHFTLF